MEIRTASRHDLDALSSIESLCFPAAEAADRKTLAARLAVYPEQFLILEDEHQIISFINGFCTDQPDLQDEMYENPCLHQPDGKWQMIFGLDTAPHFQKHGYAAILLRAFIEKAREEGRQGLVLTCKNRLISYYEKFGFQDEGLSSSQHGNVQWHQMRLTF